MIELSKIENIYLYNGYTDLRKSIDGLVVIISDDFDISDMKNKIFIFCNRGKDRLKIIEKDNNGWWIYQRRLSDGKFRWPKNKQGKLLIEKRQLLWLLEGLDVEQRHAHKETVFISAY